MRKFVLLALVAALSLAAWAVWSWAAPESPPDFEIVRDSFTVSDRLLLDRKGEVIHEMRVDPQGRRLAWTPLNRVSPALRQAVVFAEDRRFYEHSGVDWRAMTGALASALLRGRPRGASTISMQTAALLDSSLQSASSRRSAPQKLRQMRAAWVLETAWSKDQVLEAYLNLISFRGELEGISAASRGLYERDPHGLDVPQALILASLIRSPNAAPRRVLERAVLLSGSMGLQKDPVLLEQAVAPLERGYHVLPRADSAPHVARRLLHGSPAGHSSPDRVQSTLDGPLQLYALQALRQRLLEGRGSNLKDGAVLVADNRSGEVLAYIGNGGSLSSAAFVDGVRALRQAGSTLKPFLYARALERRLITPASLLDDSPLEMPVEGGLYRPTNYDDRFRGPVSAREALASSLNIPAVRVLNLVGVDDFVATLHSLGFRELRRPDDYGPSLALGSADISLWDLVNAYRTLANLGLHSSLRLSGQRRESGPVPVLGEAASFLVAMILSDRASRSLTFGLESPLATRYWSAVKTGTSKDMRDNWCVGFSRHYTVGVWVGNFSGEPMWSVSGMTGAAPVWVDVMNWLHRRRSSQPPEPPPGVVRRQVRFEAQEQRRPEWFLEGTELREAIAFRLPGQPRIVYPPSEALIALDPDIPPDSQRLFLESAPSRPGTYWRMDSEVLADAVRPVPWKPSPGPHRLELIDGQNRVLDSVTFEVRGATRNTASATAAEWKR